jgi:hypothetical protein
LLCVSGFAVLQQALGMKDVNPYNTIVTPGGRVFVQNPSGLLGAEAAQLSGETKSSKKATAG